MGVLADRRAVPAGHGGCGLRLASGPRAPGALQAVQLAWPAAGFSGDLHAGDRSVAGQSAGLVRVAADYLVVDRRPGVAGAVHDQRVVAPDAVFQVADAWVTQPVVRADRARRGADRAAGGDHYSVQLPGSGARLPPAANRPGDADHGTAAVDRVAVGGGAVQPALGRLPLGVGHRLEPVDPVLRGRGAADLGVDSR